MTSSHEQCSSTTNGVGCAKGLHGLIYIKYSKVCIPAVALEVCVYTYKRGNPGLQMHVMLSMAHSLYMITCDVSQLLVQCGTWYQTN